MRVIFVYQRIARSTVVRREDYFPGILETDVIDGDSIGALFDPDELLDAYDAETGEHVWARPASEPFDMVAFGGHLLIEGGLYTGFAADLDPATDRR